MSHLPRSQLLREAARTAAADVNGFYASAQLVALKFSERCGNDGTDIVFSNGDGVEAAVAAFSPAKRDVDV